MRSGKGRGGASAGDSSPLPNGADKDGGGVQLVG